MTHRCHWLNVPAWLDLDLHALIALGRIELDALKQFSNLIVDANRDAAWNRAGTRAKEFAKRNADSLRISVPQPALQTRFCESLAWNFAQQFVKERCVKLSGLEQSWNQLLAERFPCTIRCVV